MIAAVIVAAAWSRRSSAYRSLETVAPCARWGLGEACAPAFPFMTAVARACTTVYHGQVDRGGAVGCAALYGLRKRVGDGGGAGLAHYAMVGASSDVVALLPLGIAAVALRTSPSTEESQRVVQHIDRRGSYGSSAWLLRLRALIEADAHDTTAGGAARDAVAMLHRAGLDVAATWWPEGFLPAPLHSGKRVAVLLSGVLRSLHLTAPNLRRNVLNGLDAQEHDVFVFAEASAYAAHRLSAIADATTRAVLASFAPINESVLSPPVAQSFVLEDLQPGRLQVFLQQLLYLKRVNEMCKAHEAFALAPGVRYAAVVYVREDALYASPIPSQRRLVAMVERAERESATQLAQYPAYAGKPVIFLPTFAMYPLNDRFAFGRPEAMDVYLERLDVLVTSSVPFPLNSEGFLARVLNDEGNIAIYALEWEDAWFDIVRGASGAQNGAQSVAPGAPAALRVASSSLWSCGALCKSAAPRGLTARIAGDFGSSRVIEVEANGRSGRERRFWPTLVSNCAGQLRARLLHGDLALGQPAAAFALDSGGALDGADGATDGSLCGAFWGGGASSGWRLELPLAEARALGNITIVWTGRVAPDEYTVSVREAESGECSFYVPRYISRES